MVQRYWDVILSDRLNLAILLLQAPVIAAVIGLVFNSEGPLPVRAAAQSQIAFMLVLSAIWFGCLNAARELVKELPIYLRERSVNLSLGPYLASKLVPLAVLCALQCLMLLAIVSAVVELPGSFIERAWTLFLAGLAATTLGLTVSASVDSSDKAIAMVPILLIPQVVLSNAIVALDGIKAQDAAGAPIVSLAGAYWSDLGMVIVLGLAFLASTVFGLKLKDRRR
ncbi:MAG TPA: ABC transporter permease [Gammaproteobacteria bacterium]|nr:ABC transporter permease [Gammaproteobacteria bacterium]